MQFPLTLMGVSNVERKRERRENLGERLAASHFLNTATAATTICEKFTFQMKLHLKESHRFARESTLVITY